MNYRRLPFEQYFINTSLDRNHTGKVTYPIKYTAVKYNAGGLLSFLHIMHEMNYEIHYERSRNVIQLNFEKTTGFTDWFANVVEFSAKYYDAIQFENKPLQLRVHHGWGNMYKSIKREVRKKWQEFHEAYPDAETEIVGWSMGSGLAILCCQDLHYNFGVRSHLFTYGSVRPFKAVRSNEAAMKRYLRSTAGEAWNFADVNDLISYMPPFRRWMMIRRVDVAMDKGRRFWRLFRVVRYHSHYDEEKLYKLLDE